MAKSYAGTVSLLQNGKVLKKAKYKGRLGRHFLILGWWEEYAALGTFYVIIRPYGQLTQNGKSNA